MEPIPFDVESKFWFSTVDDVGNIYIYIIYLLILNLVVLYTSYIHIFVVSRRRKLIYLI